ncbi:MAG: Lrp/AsnC ligand binding domain-containing protein [Halanaeroarchaeum sp.]
MVRATIMIRTTAGHSPTVRDFARDLEGVLEAHVVAGDFDVIAEVEAESVHDVQAAAADAIRAHDGATETKTYVALA